MWPLGAGCRTGSSSYGFSCSQSRMDWRVIVVSVCGASSASYLAGGVSPRDWCRRALLNHPGRERGVRSSIDTFPSVPDEMQTPAAATDLAGAARYGQPQNHRGVPLPRKVVMVAK